MTVIRKIREDVFSVLGFGAHFLPTTHLMPKELLQIDDNALVDCAADEAITVAVNTLIFFSEPK